MCICVLSGNNGKWPTTVDSCQWWSVNLLLLLVFTNVVVRAMHQIRCHRSLSLAFNSWHFLQSNCSAISTKKSNTVCYLWIEIILLCVVACPYPMDITQQSLVFNPYLFWYLFYCKPFSSKNPGEMISSEVLSSHGYNFSWSILWQVCVVQMCNSLNLIAAPFWPFYDDYFRHHVGSLSGDDHLHSDQVIYLYHGW
jgi:hypothetical protein